MPDYSILVGAAAFVVVIGIRAASANRLIRKKLTFSLFLIGGFVAASAVLLAVKGDSAIASRLRPIADLVLTLAAINSLVALLFNPLRADRVPDHFPNIVQDAIIIAVFLVVGTAVMQEKWLTLSAVGGFVIGFALQDTLGNLFAGLAMQVERPFRVGHWIAVAGHEGQVTQVNWRAIRLQTWSGNEVVLPNNVVSKEPIVNYSEPAAPVRVDIEIGVTYDAPPNHVKATLMDALADLDLVSKTPPPEVTLADFGASAIVYRVKFWIAAYTARDRARDQARTAIYYALKRAGLEIPYPIQVEYRRETAPPADAALRLREIEPLIGSVDVFRTLSDAGRSVLAAACRERLYGAGETIVKQGQAGDSMFVVARGEVRVTLEAAGAEGGAGAAQEVARLGPGAYFGEMSLLTGEPRSATVSAITDCLVLEIAADEFRSLALAHPDIVERISVAVAIRREGLDRARAAVSAVAEVPEAQHGFLARVQQFLRLRPTTND